MAGAYSDVHEEVFLDLPKWPVQRAQNLLESPPLALELGIGYWKSSKISPLRRKHSS